jgi:hypothetical protein
LTSTSLQVQRKPQARVATLLFETAITRAVAEAAGIYCRGLLVCSVTMRPEMPNWKIFVQNISVAAFDLAVFAKCRGLGTDAR